MLWTWTGFSKNTQFRENPSSVSRVVSMRTDGRTWRSQ